MAEGDIIRRCEERGLKITEQRRVVARALEQSDDHPDAEELYRRASEIEPKISLATVYRTVKLFEEAGILDVRDFRDGRQRYEDAEREHHDHLIDLRSGEVVEFVDAEIEALQAKVAARLGYRLVDHRLELFGVPLDKDDPRRIAAEARRRTDADAASEPAAAPTAATPFKDESTA